MKRLLLFLFVSLITMGAKIWAEDITTADGLKTALNGSETTIKLGTGTIELTPASGASMVASDVFTVNRTVTIEGAGKDLTTIKGHFNVSPSAGAITVIFKNLTITGNNNKATHGIVGITGAGTSDVQLENCAINYVTEEVKGQLSSVGVRMEAEHAKLTMTNTDIDAHYYGIGIRNKNQTVTITNGTITGWGAIMTSAGGMTPNDGSLGSTATSISAKGTTLQGRAIVKGNSQSYAVVALQERYNGVTANFEDCTIKVIAPISTVGEDVNEQMGAFNLRSFGNTATFKNCTFEATAVKNNTTLEPNKANAVFVMGGGDNIEADQSIHNPNTITIDGGTIKGNTDSGEKLVGSGRYYTSKGCDNFTIKSGTTVNGTALAADKSYTPESGLVYYLNKITDVSTLKTAIANTTTQAGDVIYLEPGTYTEDVTLDKAVTLKGLTTELATQASDLTNQVKFAGNFLISAAATLENVALVREASYSGDMKVGMISITADIADDVIIKNCHIENNKAGTEQTGNNSSKIIIAQSNVSSGNLLVEGCKIYMNNTFQRGIAARGAYGSYTLKNTELIGINDSQKGVNQFGIAVYKPMQVNVISSRIEQRHSYAIYLEGGYVNEGVINLEVDNSTVKGFAGIYCLGNQVGEHYPMKNIIQIKNNSQIIGCTYWSGQGQAFAAMAFKYDKGSQVTIENSSILSEVMNGALGCETPFSFYCKEDDYCENITITCKNAIIQTKSNTYAPVMFIPVTKGNGTFTLDAQTKILDENGKECIRLYNADGQTFFNAAASLPRAIALPIYGYDNTLFEIAQEGTIIDMSSAKRNEVLSLINADEPLRTKEYSLPHFQVRYSDGIIRVSGDANIVWSNYILNKKGNAAPYAYELTRSSEASFNSVNDLVTALPKAAAGDILTASSVSSTDMLTALNNVSDKNLPSLMIVCSDKAMGTDAVIAALYAVNNSGTTVEYLSSSQSGFELKQLGATSDVSEGSSSSVGGTTEAPAVVTGNPESETTVTVNAGSESGTENNPAEVVLANVGTTAPAEGGGTPDIPDATQSNVKLEVTSNANVSVAGTTAVNEVKATTAETKVEVKTSDNATLAAGTVTVGVTETQTETAPTVSVTSAGENSKTTVTKVDANAGTVTLGSTGEGSEFKAETVTTSSENATVDVKAEKGITTITNVTADAGTVSLTTTAAAEPEAVQPKLEVTTLTVAENKTASVELKGDNTKVGTFEAAGDVTLNVDNTTTPVIETLNVTKGAFKQTSTAISRAATTGELSAGTVSLKPDITEISVAGIAAGTATYSKVFTGIPGNDKETPKAWYTICLPFDVDDVSATKADNSPIENITFNSGTTKVWLYKYDASNANNNENAVVFVEADKIEANIPYLISVPGTDWTDNGVPVTSLDGYTLTFKAANRTLMTEDKIESGTAGYKFANSYKQYTSSEKSDYYILNASENQFQKTPSTTLTLGAFEGFFLANAGTRSTSPNALNIIFGSIVPTGIDTPQADEAEKMSIKAINGQVVIKSPEITHVEVYNVNGMLIRSIEVQEGTNYIDLPKGFYIINKTKVIL